MSERIDVEYPCDTNILTKKQYYYNNLYFILLIRIKGEYICYNCCCRCDTVSIYIF